MDSQVWVPLEAVVIGGLLTTISTLLVEVFRDRARERRDLRQRRRGALEELERSVIDHHAKVLSTTQIADLLVQQEHRTESDGAVDGEHLPEDSDGASPTRRSAAFKFERSVLIV